MPRGRTVFDTTRKSKTPRLLPNEQYIILNEDLEHAMPESDVEYIKDMFLYGRSVHAIAKDIKRDVWEVIMALVHLARHGEVEFTIYRWSKEE